MKRSTFITIISLLIPLLGISQTESTFVDDVYLKPSDAKVQVSNQSPNTRSTPNYKNGAREIRYIERESPNTKIVHDTVYVEGQANEVRRNNSSRVVNGIIHDTIYISGPVNDNRENSTITQETPVVLGEANDSTENNQEQGYYLNGFKGTQSDLEYAERIRRFHNPRYEIFVGDPRYNDIYFLNDNDWNVYIDGSYAYVTPTWTNPYWWNYNYSPYGYYGGYGWNYPWGYNNFYGGFGFGGYYDDYFGFGGYYGYDYPYYGYGYPYYGYGYNNWGNYGRNPAHTEEGRREVSNLSGTDRIGGATRSSQSMMIGGGSSYSSSNPYTVISNSGSRSVSQNSTSSASELRSTNASKLSSSRLIYSNSNGIGAVRTGGLRNINSINQSNLRSNNGLRTTYTINTAPRTATRNGSSSVITTNSATIYSTRGNYISGGSNLWNYSTAPRSTGSNATYSTGSRSSSSFSNGSSTGSSSSSRSSGSYSSGGSTGGGGGSRSSGGSGSRR